MKKLLFLGAFLLQAAFMSAQYTISAKDLAIKPGTVSDDEVYLEIEMSYPASDQIRMAQFNITLPEGMTFDEDAFEIDEGEEGYFPVDKKGKSVYSVDYNLDDDGSTIVAVTTSKNYFFQKNEGVALRALVLTDANMALDTYKVKIEKGEFYSPSTGTHKDITSEATIIVTEDVGINDITVGGKNTPVYNTAGQRVSRTSKGLYIQNGKKVVKK